MFLSVSTQQCSPTRIRIGAKSPISRFHHSTCRGTVLFTAANKEVLRSQAISLLSRLLWYDRAQFKRFLGLLAASREIPFLMGFLHGYLGFCAEPSHPGCPSPLPATSKNMSQVFSSM